MASNGFIAATRRNPGSCCEPPEPGHVELALAHHGDQDVEGLLGDAVDLLDVQQRAVAQCRGERAVDEHVGVVALGQHAGRIEVADEAGRRQFGVALDELEAHPEFVGHGAQQRRLAGARGSFDDDVAVGDERGDDQFDLAPPADDVEPIDATSSDGTGSRCGPARRACSDM
jgi:hypothetical protein